MALETATYISGLNANNPVTATDIVREGSDHLRLVKSTILNTFPNLTGAMTKTHTELNNAPDASASSLFSITDPTDLVDNGNALNIGTLAGAHLALDPNTLQAKASATAAAVLYMNRLGGHVTVGGGAAGSQTLAIDAATGQDARLDFYENAVAQARIFHDASADTLKVRMLNAGDKFRVEQGDGASIMAKFDPDGAAELGYATNIAFLTRSNGIQVQAAGATANATLEMIDGDSETARLVKRGDGHLRLINDEASGHLDLYGTDSLSATAVLAEFDPDQGATIYRKNEVQFLSVSDTVMELREIAASGSVRLHFRDDGATTLWGQINAAAAEVGVRAYGAFRIQADAATHGGNGDTYLLTSANYLSLYAANAEALRTQNGIGTGDETMYGQIRNRQGNFEDIGMNVAPVSIQSGAYTLQRNTVGWLVRKTGAGDIDITTGSTSLSPEGSMWMVMNDSGAAITIDANTGVSLFWSDGAGGSTGDRTLADGGICTIWRRGANNYHIWGVGLS